MPKVSAQISCAGPGKILGSIGKIATIVMAILFFAVQCDSWGNWFRGLCIILVTVWFIVLLFFALFGCPQAILGLFGFVQSSWGQLGALVILHNIVVHYGRIMDGTWEGVISLIGLIVEVFLLILGILECVNVL